MTMGWDGMGWQIVDLNGRVQATGGSALTTAKELLQQRHAARNVEAATQVIIQARFLYRMGMLLSSSSYLLLLVVVVVFVVVVMMVVVVVLVVIVVAMDFICAARLHHAFGIHCVQLPAALCMCVPMCACLYVHIFCLFLHLYLFSPSLFQFSVIVYFIFLLSLLCPHIYFFLVCVRVCFSATG